MNLSYFIEFTILAETQNYWEASERLYMNQSTLSKHIKTMEAELGVPLFARTTRHVELTEYGIALLPYAQSITRAQFEYSTLLRQIQNQKQGLITIGTIPSMAQYQITDLLLKFQKEHPECHIKLIEEDSKQLFHLLSEHKCDLAFIRNSSLFSDAEAFSQYFCKIPFDTDHLVAVLPSSHPFAHKQEISLRELRDENFCFIKEGTMLYEFCSMVCHASGFIPNIVFDSHRLESILDMVRKGNCISLLMNRQADYAALDDPRLSIVRITPGASTQISIYYPTDTQLSANAKIFLEFVTR